MTKRIKKIQVLSYDDNSKRNRKVKRDYDNKIKEEDEKGKEKNESTRNILTLQNILDVKEKENNKKVKNKIIFKKKENNSNSSINTNEMRIITIPRKRMGAVRSNWLELIKPVVTNLKLEIRMNKDKIEVRTCSLTEDKNTLQKASDYIKAYLIGFSIEDSLALLRIDDLYIETFQIKDVKILKGDHLSRCIGRICGSNGSTKYAIENATKTRIVIAADKIHILGSFDNIKMARYSICSLILGTTQSKIFNKLNILAKRLKERF
ncbi:pre-rRNA-processing protein PNO1, putative [Plasmodium malariae]|uniref:Pre-rRNA-processing protein PNO1, putative n=1 Tax=Plasmodium malariae TaxID=5858 RepID=A0A1C3L132_PLAMA|nr:pre-rRNA-processing protein PNO1, putative [Plasmodium malariae]